MKKTHRNMALAAVVVLSASSLLRCNSNVQIPDEVKVQQGTLIAINIHIMMVKSWIMLENHSITYRQIPARLF